MGGKILWNMISGKNTWSKQILQKKYFTGNRNRCLEKPPKKQTGSPIFLLCKKALPYFTAKLTWIPGNGANINIWDDSILGNQPLNSLIELRNIQAWLSANNRCTLWDISTWGNDDQNSWVSWNVGNYPEELKEEALLLMDMLQGKTPISVRSKDKRGWGSGTGKFSASAGYSAILERPWAPPNPGPWKFIWNYPSIPKIDLFIWQLLHNSILTSENLRRKGWAGPSRCPLCRNAEENADHLFTACDFTLEVWEIMLGSFDICLPSTVMEMVSRWPHLYPHDLSKKPLIKITWMWIPKFLSWKIWLERNNRLFREESRVPAQVAIKARVMLTETLNIKAPKSNTAPLSNEEDQWIKEYQPVQNSKEVMKPPHKASWEIRLAEMDFIKWRSVLNEWCLFFDGASKGNPGKAGGGGIILEPSGKIHLSYAWGLGQASNNQAEILALWQGLTQARNLNIQKINIFGDSRLIIKAVHTKKVPSDIYLGQIFKKICLLLSQFRNYKAQHVLRNLNSLADAEANQGVLLNKSQLSVNGGSSTCAIP